MTPKAQVISAKLNKWDYIKIKIQYSKGNNRKNEKIKQGVGQIFSNHISNRVNMQNI